MLAKRKESSAFTLLEVVVTLSIMTILGTIAVYSLSPLREQPGVGSAQSQLHTLLRLTRSQAILKGRDARLIIHDDIRNPDKRLSYMGIVVRTDPTSDIWEAAHDGSWLADGVRFVPNPAGGQALFPQVSIYRSSNDIANDASARFALIYPSSLEQQEGVGATEEWIYYQFGPDGALSGAAGGLAPQNSQAVVALGDVAADGSASFQSNSPVAGVRIRANGIIVSIDDKGAL